MTITRSGLWRRLWLEVPPQELAKELGCSNVAIARACKRFGFEPPYAGYWMVKLNGGHPPVISLRPGPDAVWTLSRSHRKLAAVVPGGTGVNPFDVLQATIEHIQKADGRAFVAFWLAVGSSLRSMEMARLDWSMVSDAPDGRWHAAGPLGRGGKTVSAVIAPQAAHALTPHRKASGLVLVNAEVDRRKVRWILGMDWRRRVMELRAAAGS